MTPTLTLTLTLCRTLTLTLHPSPRPSHNPHLDPHPKPQPLTPHQVRSTVPLAGSSGRERYGFLEQNFDRSLMELFSEVHFCYP